MSAEAMEALFLIALYLLPVFGVVIVLTIAADYCERRWPHKGE